MWRREITKENLMELLISAAIFIIIFIVGSTVFLLMEMENYNIFATWCMITALISMVIIGAYSYIKLRAQIMNYEGEIEFPYNKKQ